MTSVISLDTAAKRPPSGEPRPPLSAGPGPEAELILVFASTTEVLNVEDHLEELDLPFELVPVPKAVNPNCGLAISFAEQVRPEIMAALDEGGFVPTAAYLRRGDDFQPLTESREEGRESLALQKVQAAPRAGVPPSAPPS